MNEEMTTKETQINTNTISTQQKHLNNGNFFLIIYNITYYYS